MRRLIRAFLTGLIFGLLLAGCDIILESPSGWRITFRPSPVQPTAPTAPPIWPTNTPRPTGTPVATATATAAIDPTPTREVWQPTAPVPAGLLLANITDRSTPIEVRVRSCPAIDCETLGLIRPGESVELLLEEPLDNWYHVLVEREGEGLVPGWVFNNPDWWEIVFG